MREGLVQSKNTITAQVMNDVGADAVASFAQAAGVRDSKLDLVPSLALGTSPVTLLEMGDAYATLADMGVHHDPLFITQIVDRGGQVLESFDSKGERVLDEAVIQKLVDVMRGVTQTGTGTGIRTEFHAQGDLAAKTGTTQNNTDGWFMLMSPKLVMGAWVGFNDQRVTIRSNYWGQGGHNALRIVGSFMQQAEKAKLVDVKAEFPQVVRDAPEEAAPASAPEADAATPDSVATTAPGPLSAIANVLGLSAPSAKPAAAPAVGMTLEERRAHEFGN
jgi:penicillin-binding protein 1A